MNPGAREEVQRLHGLLHPPLQLADGHVVAPPPRGHKASVRYRQRQREPMPATAALHWARGRRKASA
eukprot:8929929-Lingulodinium_polyedra.AAC.1